MAVQVVFTFLGKKFQGAGKALFGPQGLSQVRVGGVHGKEVGLPSQFLGRMGVGVGNQQEAVQGPHPPVHGRVGGQPGLQGIDLRQRVFKTFFQGIEAALAAQDRKPRGPDVGRDHQGLGVDFQHQFQQEFGIQPEDGAAVRGHVAQAAQTLGQFLRRFQSGKEQQQMHLPDPPGLFVNGADLAGDHEADGRNLLPGRTLKV